jgi:hypothetical protein
MSLTPGTRLGPYEVVAQIGEGGMGEVYRATDTNLKRQVAIKVLPEAVASDTDRLEQFSHPYSASISAVADEIGALGGCKELQGDGDPRVDLRETPGTSGSEEGLQLGEGLLDGIEVGTVRREKAELRAGSLDRLTNGGVFVDRQVVEDDHVARCERGHQHLLDISLEAHGVDRAIEDGRGGQGLWAQGRDDRAGVPVLARCVVLEPCAAGTAAVAPQQIRGDAALIEKHIVAGVADPLAGAPPPPVSGDVGAPLFVGVKRFF